MLPLAQAGQFGAQDGKRLQREGVVHGQVERPLARRARGNLQRVLSMRQEVFNGDSDVLGDLSQENRGYVSSAMKRHCSTTSIRMGGTACESLFDEPSQSPSSSVSLLLLATSGRDTCPLLGNRNQLCADKLTL